jgi:SAM-dependent methyltransferase
MMRGKNGAWYLDRVVALQKKHVHLGFIRRGVRDAEARIFLKTDLFEESGGEDQILFDLHRPGCTGIGMDMATDTVIQAARRCPAPGIHFLACDIRHPALRPGSMDLILSISTLDHVESAADFRAGLGELVQLLSPGGLLIVTLDNPQNPMYHPLRWASRRGWLPFKLGYTASMRELNRLLAQLGLEILANEWLLHNPRMISTLLCLGLRKLLRKHADRPIRALLMLFAVLGRLPTRRWTACFVAACARRPPAADK